MLASPPVGACRPIFLRLIRKAFKQLLRRVGIDIRFIPKLGFDAYADMRKLVATDRPLVFDIGANRGQTIDQFRNAFARPVIHAFEPGRATFADLQRAGNSVAGYVDWISFVKDGLAVRADQFDGL